MDRAKTLDLLKTNLGISTKESSEATGRRRAGPSRGGEGGVPRSIMKSRTKDDKKGKKAGAGADAGGSNDGAGADAELHQSARRRYHDALSSGVGLDAVLHGTSRAMPGFPRASKHTPPSSPPRMFPAPGQDRPRRRDDRAVGALDVNNGAPHPAGARSRPNASSAAHHGGSRPSLESSTRAAVSRSSASDRWRAAGAAAGVPEDVGEGTKKKRSGFILAYKAVKRSMGIPSKKDKAAAKESAEAEAKPRGAAAFASVLPPRKNPGGAPPRTPRRRRRRTLLKISRQGTSGPPRARRRASPKKRRNDRRC